ncbi:MAG: phosphatase [Clostridiales bacterium]|nr:phosphatase [Clostridiales bacterium]
MNLAMRVPEIDTHTHTVVSGHAWSTLTENVNSARQKGLKGICLTEHGPDMPQGAPGYTPLSQTMIPQEIDGVRIYRGIEANIIDFDGCIDIHNEYLPYCEFVIASIHRPVLVGGTIEQNTNAYIKALQNPHIDTLGHPEDPKVVCDFESVVKEAIKQNKLLEMNNNSLSAIRTGSMPSLIKYINICKQMQARVCVASDAHFYTMVGNVSPIMRLLDELQYPPELIVNLTLESFEKYLSERKSRLK